MGNSSPTQEKYGYDDRRFETNVDEQFHCSICYNVLKEPRSCKSNDHTFCLGCITQHLNFNSQTCPECNENLSVDTLRRPRLVNNYLSKLKINCDHASRGCPEFVCVEDLKTHVENCGFAPVSCSNENCGAKINKKDKVHHETVECQYRTTKCHDCGQVREDVDALKESLLELDRKVEAVSGKVQNSHVGITTVVGKLKGSFVELDRKMETTNRKLEDLNGKVEASSATTKNEIAKVKKEVSDVKLNLYKVSKDVDEMKVMMSQMLEKFDIPKLSKKLPSPTEGMMSKPRQDILIAGGNGPSRETGKSTEIFSLEKNGWFEVSPMNEEHDRASSFVFNGRVFIVGGEKSNAIETLDRVKELHLTWTILPGNLPYACYDNQTVVYEQRIFHIGGYDYNESPGSNVICELKLTSTCTMKELCQMPEPRGCYRAEVVQDKIFILGGERPSNSVLKLNPRKNKCRKVPPLQRNPLTRMATVAWRDQVVVIGGRDEVDTVLNDVFMYDCKTGKITVLPSMLERRCECCAIITGDTIAVMGGLNEKRKVLNSVECFTMGESTWKYLPAMNKARRRAVAEVLPPPKENTCKIDISKKK